MTEPQGTAEDWLPIPDFSGYRIHLRSKEVQSCMRKGGWRTLTPSGTTGTLRLRSDSGKAISARAARLAYCAINGISPLMLKSNLYVVETREGGLRLCDSYGFAEHKMMNRAPKSTDHIKGEYARAQRTISLILKAYETDDYRVIAAEIWSYEGRMAAYLRNRGKAFSEAKIRELWAETFKVTMDAIRGRKACIVNVFGYLRRVANTLVATDRKMRSRITSLNNKEISDNGI